VPTEKDVVKEVHRTGSGRCPMVEFGTINTKLCVQLDEMKCVVSTVTWI
jgi:hypothetical protein